MDEFDSIDFELVSAWGILYIRLSSKDYWVLGLGLISSVILMQNIALAQCPPSGAVTITSCCDSPWTDIPCGVPVNKTIFRSLIRPSVTVTPDVGNPNHVTISTANGSYICGVNSACTGLFCNPSPLKYIITPYYTPNPVTIIPSIDRNYPNSAWIGGDPNHVDLTKLPSNQCTLKSTWSAGCGVATHSDTYDLGPCQLAPQTKPQPVPKMTKCKMSLSSSGKDCGFGVPDPVDPYSGDYYYAEEDLVVPGLIPLRVVRSYTSSLSGFTGPFGVGTYLAGYNYNLVVPKYFTEPNCFI